MTRDDRQRPTGFGRREILATAAAAGAFGAGGGAVAASAPDDYGAPLVELFVPAGALSPDQRRAMIRDLTDVVLAAAKLPPSPQRRLFVEIFETAESGFGVDGQVFVPAKRP